jgi:hypothetical protein
MTTTPTDVLDYARLAPSVHNTQPWCFHIDDSTITLRVAPERTLDAGDPTGRELWVSLGICLETILQAAKGLGVTATITSLQTDTITGDIAHIQLAAPTAPQQDILDLIKNRYSYRAPMSKTSISASCIDTCREAIADLPNVSLTFVDDTQTLAQIATITDKGMRLALSSTPFRKELAPLLHYNWSKARVGLHGFVLNHGLLGSIWEKWSVIFGVDSKRKAAADRQKVLESSGLLFILSKGDVPHFWLGVGRAYMRVALEITRADLVHSTLTAPVEAARFHEDIEAMLGTTDRIQSMIRLGKATTRPTHTSPRLPLDELLI